MLRRCYKRACKQSAGRDWLPKPTCRRRCGILWKCVEMRSESFRKCVWKWGLEMGSESVNVEMGSESVNGKRGEEREQIASEQA